MNLVELKPLLPKAIFDIRYATTNNFTGEIQYINNRTRLDEGAAQALVKANQSFESKGYTLVIYDAYRPIEVQKQLQIFNRDEKYVLTDSNHPKGLAIDVSLADKNGDYLDMGTDFDDFTTKAHIDAKELTESQIINRSLLADVMELAGFRQWPYEWWHFDFVG